MKANEAPEKIYMTPCFGEPDNVLLASFSKSHLEFHLDIEYTRTDAFIEKATKWITENYLKYPSEDCTDTKKFVNDFKNALKI